MHALRSKPVSRLGMVLTVAMPAVTVIEPHLATWLQLVLPDYPAAIAIALLGGVVTALSAYKRQKCGD